jgi:hypothetical protein
MPVRRYKQNVKKSYKRYSTWDYSVLYSALSTYHWSSRYNERSIYAAVDRLNVAVTQTIDFAVRYGYFKKYNYTAWFSGKCTAYIG